MVVALNFNVSFVKFVGESKEMPLNKLDEGIQASPGFAELSIKSDLLCKEEGGLSLSFLSYPDSHDRHAV